MRVYVIRHGESETNRAKKWTGWLDVNLTDKGKADAKKAGDFIKHISFEKIYASDLSRAGKTAEIAIPGCKYETSALLREINVGSLAGNPIDSLTDKQRDRNAEVGYVDFGGESKTEFNDRISRFMKELEGSECENVAVFSHAGWLCGMLNIVLGSYVPRKHVCCNNCTIAIYEYTNKTWRLHSWINFT
ncbi:MAG: histidine phosphatase family protein [Clostridia bacterium]|nr:histidine phosphatase family protein [Clostridia bacterium]